MKETMSTVILLVLLFSLLCCPAAALGDEDYEYGSSFDWSPTIARYYVVPDDTDSTLLTVATWFKFSTEAAQINNNIYYFTMEHNARKPDGIQRAPMDAEYYYSTLPGVHYDLDDDDDPDNNSPKDDYREECEAIATGTLVANTEYYFTTRYRKLASFTAGKMLIVAQRSVLLKEYQAVHADYLVLHSWNSTAVRSVPHVYEPTQPSVSNTSGASASAENSATLFKAPSDKSELDTIVAQTNTEYLQALAKFAKTRSAEGTSSIARATITFANPISMEDMLSTVDACGATLVTYQAKFIDENGVWCSLGGSDTDEARMIQCAAEFAAESGIVHQSYEGITSAIVELDVQSATYSLLKDSPLVYFVDMSEFIWETSAEYDSDANVVVPNYAWHLAQLSEEAE